MTLHGAFVSVYHYSFQSQLMDIYLITSGFLQFKHSHKNIMIQAVSVVYCISQRFFDVPSLSSFHPQKVRDNYGSKKAHYQSRLTTSQQAELLTPFYLLKCSRREDKLRNPHLRDPADFPTNFCLSLHVWGVCESSAI